MGLVFRDAGTGPAARTQVGRNMSAGFARPRTTGSTADRMGWLFCHHRLLEGTELARICTTVSESAAVGGIRTQAFLMAGWQAQSHSHTHRSDCSSCHGHTVSAAAVAALTVCLPVCRTPACNTWAASRSCGRSWQRQSECQQQRTQTQTMSHSIDASCVPLLASMHLPHRSWLS